MKAILSILLAGSLLQASCQGQTGNAPTEKPKNPYYSRTDTRKLDISDAEWKKVLSPEVYAVAREKETERAFTGKLWDFEGKGTYYCAACGNLLFRSTAKFASECGWPSFFEQSNPASVVFEQDNSHGMIRLEAVCGRCGGHLGHLFDDGPPPTGKRYCMNSIVLDFEPDKTGSLQGLARQPLAVQASFTGSPAGEGPAAAEYDTLTLGGGCYWCVEAVYENLKGVVSVVSGFSGGSKKDADYDKVSTGTTGHAEVVQVVFDKGITSLDELFKVFFTVHDPTTPNQQGADMGPQYRSVIFYRNAAQQEAAKALIAALAKARIYDAPIVTTVEPFKAFYKAEEYHQDYFAKNRDKPYCQMVIQPKLEKFEKLFKDRLKH